VTNTQNGKNIKRHMGKLMTSLPQERIFSASWLGERKYAEPSQFLKEILRKKTSTFGEKLYWQGRREVRDFDFRLLPKKSLKAIFPRGKFLPSWAHSHYREAEGFSTAVEITVETGGLQLSVERAQFIRNLHWVCE